MNLNALFESVARQQRHLYGGNMKDASSRTIEGLVELIAELEKKHEEAVRLLREILRLDSKETPIYPEWKKDWHETVNKARQFLATQETT
jgi:hypothetical protein